MTLYRSLTAKVDMVLEQGEVFVRPFGGEFVHISAYKKPKRNPEKSLFESCLLECTEQTENGFHSSEPRRVKECVRAIEEHAEAQGRLAAQVSHAYDRWMKR